MHIVEHVQTTAATVGSTMTIGGSATAVIFGVAFNQVEMQLLGIAVGAIVGVFGLFIQAIDKYKNYRLAEQKALQSGEWDGKERRNGTR